jgi:hypothetical protein
MAQAKPEAMAYLLENHTKKWTRSPFLPNSKVDFVTNNLAESFNNWIKPEKGKHLDDLMDTIRQKMLIKWNHRKRVARTFEGKILPHIVKKLREDSFNLDIEVITSSIEGVAEVCAKGTSNAFRFVVDLGNRTCTCNAWQGTRIPCKHAIAYITSIPGARLEDYIDESILSRSSRKHMQALSHVFLTRPCGPIPHMGSSCTLHCLSQQQGEGKTG